MKLKFILFGQRFAISINEPDIEITRHKGIYPVTKEAEEEMKKIKPMPKIKRRKKKRLKKKTKKTLS